MNSFMVGGIPRALGCLPGLRVAGRLVSASEPWSSSNPVLGDKDLKEFDNTISSIPILDQGQTGSCAGHSAANAIMKGRAKSGLSHVALSPFFLYGLANGGVDRGATMEGILRAATSTGACRVSVNPNKIMYQNRFTKEMFDDAKNYRVSDSYVLDTFESLLTAVLLSWDVIFGIGVGNAFFKTDNEGTPGTGSGAGGHAMADGEGLRKHPRHGWQVKVRNSWGESYGVGGYCWLDRRHFTSSFFDGYAIRAVNRGLTA